MVIKSKCLGQMEAFHRRKADGIHQRKFFICIPSERWLAQLHPEWTSQELADSLSMSRSWVSKWRKLLRQADPADVLALHSRSRARRTEPSSIASQPAVVQRILEIRVAPPENLQRVPGPEAIL